MHDDPKALGDGRRQVRPTRFGSGPMFRLQELGTGRRDLTGAPWTRLGRHQAPPPRLPEGGVRGIERLSAKPEATGHSSDRFALDMVRPEHLIFDLDQVPSIEEPRVLLKQRVVHLLRIESGGGCSAPWASGVL